MVSAVSSWHLCNLPRACSLFALVSIADMFQVSKYWLSRDKDWNIPWPCWLFAFHIVTSSPAIWLEPFTKQCVACSRIIIFIIFQLFFRDCRSFTSRKVHMFLPSVRILITCLLNSVLILEGKVRLISQSCCSHCCSFLKSSNLGYSMFLVQGKNCKNLGFFLPHRLC